MSALCMRMRGGAEEGVRAEGLACDGIVRGGAEMVGLSGRKPRMPVVYSMRVRDWCTCRGKRQQQ